MKYRIIYIVCLLSAIALSGQAQKETWNWCFGYRAGLSFHPDSLRSFAATGVDGTPDAILKNIPGFFSSKVVTNEGVFTISSKNGDLLFYSDGIKIWKADGTEIFDGLKGNTSSTQSGIVLPYPEDEKKFICVGLDERNNNNMNYVLVQANSSTDVTVVGTAVAFSGHKGLLGESMSAIQHGNRKDWWIVAAGRGKPIYLNAWQVTSSGVTNTAPVKNNLEIDSNSYGASGYLKFTPDGKHFVLLLNGTCDYFIYGDFNNLTGEFSNIGKTALKSAYGLEFSPNLKYVYITANNTGTGSTTTNIYVYDFEALLQGNTTEPIKTISAYRVYALQLDSFGRIWGACVESNPYCMYLIDNPNEPTNLKVYGISYKSFMSSSSEVKLGLPSFSASWFAVSNIKTDNEAFCVNTEQSYSIIVNKGSGLGELGKTIWDFGDGSMVITDTNVNGTQTHFHTYTKPGRYTITVKSFLKSDGLEVTDQRETLEVTVSPCVMPVNPNIHLY
ncbi:hypothetical protein M2459_001566 [Parabacteroides sp. PF5-5]|uniref:PKD domain-containing protein n=1 Tax=unclassified Parabacteroides TaxID=2649774 RepID=UPI002477201A|nr:MULTISPECIES: PKD domain-containing protein [unclassified Parabacteroides]MDH6304830.1 hypothetical protein [Parabacteroides sp. PH5-39]MDH6315556.1 hypothetical protein [Parabacteroides sp. PF5-13]MDH6319216.1 hypothetical protein [Parabacteroides sp. PH5-13]MDH6322947.1 hypothetical protein [Parabacteroides sp. PH5-8]MDH6326749.1 hypothetical protein [Parabacteroides sp. PH5-41]